jgi:hypothetical protein
MPNSDAPALQQLAHAIAQLGEEVQRQAAERYVTTAALLALVRSHPRPEQFAKEFRRVWQLLGSPHSNEEAGHVALESISEALAMLEDACPVPLAVRPPPA